MIKSLLKKIILKFKFFSSLYCFLKVNFHYLRINQLKPKNKSVGLINKIFICHHTPLKNRKIKLKKFVKYIKADIEWVEKFQPNELKRNYSEIVGLSYMTIDPSQKPICQDQYTYFKNAGTRINISELSLYLKMKYCFESQIKNEYNLIVILEDDIILNKNINNYLNCCAEEFCFHEENLDCLMIGSSFNLKSKFFKKGKLIHYGEKQLTRCTHAMMFNLDAAKKIHSKLFPINWPIDFKLNEIIIRENLKVAWSEPGLLQFSNYFPQKSSISKNR